MKRPSGNKVRKITDANQVYLDSINPPIMPEVGKTMIERCAPKGFAEKTIRTGK